MKSGVKRIIFTVVVLTVLISGVFLINLCLDRNVYVTRYFCSSEKIPQEFEGYRIAVISDVHNSRYCDKIIDLLDREGADAVFLTGDMIQELIFVTY